MARPAGSHRSTPPVTRLKVTERWRSGDFSVNSLLAVVPAQVEGLAVSCPEGRDQNRGLPNRRGRYDGDNPVLAAIGGKEPEDTVLPRIDWGDVITNPDPDLTVHRAQLLDGLPLKQGRAKCSSRALAAPVYDAREPMHHGDDERKQDIHEGWKAAGFRPGPLDNAVVLRTGPFAHAVLFLLVRRELLEGGLVVCAFDADENELSREPVTPAATSLPPRWTDTSGPWSTDAFLLSQQATAMARLGYFGVLVEVKGGEAADHVQIGMPPEETINERLDVRGYYLAGTELTSYTEYLRYDWDETDRVSQQSAIANVLGGDTDDYALLHPDTVYRATVGYSVQARPVLPDGTDGPAADVPSSPQEFFFRTDNLPPRRLDPWILGSTPQEGEQHFPTGEAIKIIFGTTNVVRMFAAYGKRLTSGPPTWSGCSPPTASGSRCGYAPQPSGPSRPSPVSSTRWYCSPGPPGETTTRTSSRPRSSRPGSRRSLEC